jgi:alpha-tubulin suppressor-like RCC1 family protein
MRTALAILAWLAALPGCAILDDFGDFEFAPAGGDSGARDAETDAADRDDASLDAGVDASMPDSGPTDAGPDASCGQCQVPGDGGCAPAEDGTSCRMGLCNRGACCTGCLDGTECRTGDVIAACGRRGAACVACTCDGDTCSATSRVCSPSRSVSKVSAGEAHTCAVGIDGSLFCWGVGNEGQLGHGAVGPAASRASPTAVTMPAATGWIDVAAGGRHTCARRDDGTLHCFGQNDFQQLGIGPGPSAPAAMAVPPPATEQWVALDAGDAFTCAITSSGNLWCWGRNHQYQLGLGRMDAGGVPPERVATLVPPTAFVATGDNHACAIDADATLRCWGLTDTGQTGSGTMGWGAITPMPTPVMGTMAAWSAAGGGTAHTCGVGDDASLWCWGHNVQGQLGLGAGAVGPMDHPVPERVPGTTLWRTVSAGWQHTCALDDDAGIWCWGEGSAGRLGHGAVASFYEPEPVDGEPLEWGGVDAGRVHTCAWTQTGAVYCWGQGLFGRLGTGMGSDELAPARVCLPEP